MYPCTYTYLYVCTYTCAYLSIYIYESIYIHIGVCVYIYTHIPAINWASPRPYIHIYIRIRIHTHTHTHTYIHTYIYIYVSIYIYESIYIHICIHIHVYTYIPAVGNEDQLVSPRPYIHIYTRPCIHTHMLTDKDIHICIHICTYIHIYTHTSRGQQGPTCLPTSGESCRGSDKKKSLVRRCRKLGTQLRCRKCIDECSLFRSLGFRYNSSISGLGFWYSCISSLTPSVLELTNLDVFPCVCSCLYVQYQFTHTINT
jgi:hypothetical protein